MISGILTKAAIKAIRIYRIAISPYHGPVCRYTPSCSQYAEEALRKYGPVKGPLKALWRLLRCHPFSAGGYDPVR
jgi:putative membrane protein insertion efficiency factor